MNLYPDNIIRFLNACFDAGIKRPEAFLISKMVQTYNWLRGCFPRGILPTDIDGFIEISGHFLFLEFKHESALRNGAVPKGQSMAFRGLVEIGRGKIAVALIGTDDDGEPTCIEVWHPGRPYQLRDCDKEGVKEFCRRWSAWVEQQTKRKAA